MAEGALVIRQLLRSRYPVRAVLVTDQGAAALAEQLASVGRRCTSSPRR